MKRLSVAALPAGSKSAASEAEFAVRASRRGERNAVGRRVVVLVQVVEQTHPAEPLHDGRQHIGCPGVVKEMRAGRVLDRQGEEGTHPPAGRIAAHDVRGVRIVAGGHAEQVANAHGPQVSAWLGRRLVGKECEHRVIDR